MTLSVLIDSLVLGSSQPCRMYAFGPLADTLWLSLLLIIKSKAGLLPASKISAQQSQPLQNPVPMALCAGVTGDTNFSTHPGLTEKPEPAYQFDFESTETTDEISQLCDAGAAAILTIIYTPASSLTKEPWTLFTEKTAGTARPAGSHSRTDTKENLIVTSTGPVLSRFVLSAGITDDCITQCMVCLLVSQSRLRSRGKSDRDNPADQRIGVTERVNRRSAVRPRGSAGSALLRMQTDEDNRKTSDSDTYIPHQCPSGFH
ncbi:hypothetical protein BaRGS_00036349 [Batillaria attramentaria]|uniref:Uncharacterized protein n=1 Tax=Batillaria attramentaria TaxID=370345 RepID=A0ABD0JC88_9CAEN